MKLKHFLIFILAGSAVISVSGQSNKKKVVKPKPITATVTVKADPSIKPLPKEMDVWNEFELKEDDLTVSFPGRQEDIFDDIKGPVRIYQVSTAKAEYMLAIRDLGVVIDNRNIDQFLEETIRNAFGDQQMEKKAIRYDGRSGRQIIFNQGGKRFVARLFVLNGKLFITSVSVKQRDYEKGFDKWIDKFFDSFRVKVRVVEA